MRKNIVFSLIVCVFLSSCGYHIGDGGALSSYQTFTVPYIDGDRDGVLTAALIKELAHSGSLFYCRKGAQLIVQVSLIETNEEHIGFQYGREKKKKRQKLEKSVVPIETRITAVACVTIKETSSCCTLLGPVEIEASVDFDHEYYFTSDESNNTIPVNVFSLGQLNDIEAARDDVKEPLYHALAQKIAQYVIHFW